VSSSSSSSEGCDSDRRLAKKAGISFFEVMDGVEYVRGCVGASEMGTMPSGYRFRMAMEGWVRAGPTIDRGCEGDEGEFPAE
jgi:hypothetical protein